MALPTNERELGEVNATGKGKLRVLLVGHNMLSHVLAMSKMARWLEGAGHEVLWAVPGEAAVAAAEDQLLGSDVKVVQAGENLQKTQANVHGATDFRSWRAFLGAFLHPDIGKVGEIAETLTPMYPALLQLIKSFKPDVVVHNHATWSPAGDAAEKAGLPVVCIVHLPYDPSWFMGYETTWRYPRVVPFFPHVASYPAEAELCWHQRCWQWLDAQLAVFMWRRVDRQLQHLKAERGLPATPCSMPAYFARHPCIVLGGPPFCPPAPVPPLTTVVGSLEPEPPALPLELQDWVAASPCGCVLVTMGTGQVLSTGEARQIARGLGRGLAGSGGPRLLWSLKTSQQEELKEVLFDELGSPEVKDGSWRFLDGAVRVESFVPQYSLLASGHVKLFLSHMGFGAFTESVRCGVPMIGHPGGFDQEHNAVRAIEAGLGVRAPKGFEGLEAMARRCLADPQMQQAAQRARRLLHAMDSGGEAAVRAVERFAWMSREDAAQLRPALACAWAGESDGSSSRLPHGEMAGKEHPKKPHGAFRTLSLVATSMLIACVVSQASDLLFWV